MKYVKTLHMCATWPILHYYCLFRYCELEDPMGLRRTQLEDSVQLHQFTHDSNEEMRWVKEREPAAKSTLLGDSLTSVQGLIKKHQVRLSICKT